MTPTVFSVGVFFAVIISIIATRQRAQLAQAWRDRELFRPEVYWGVALLYAIAGAIVTFSAFGGVRFGLGIAHPAMQILAVVGLLGMGGVHLLARFVATPVFEAHAIPQDGRRHFHGLWMGFWLVGTVAGLVPAMFT